MTVETKQKHEQEFIQKVLTIIAIDSENALMGALFNVPRKLTLDTIIDDLVAERDALRDAAKAEAKRSVDKITEEMGEEHVKKQLAKYPFLQAFLPEANKQLA